MTNKRPDGIPEFQMPDEAHGGFVLDPDRSASKPIICPQCGHDDWCLMSVLIGLKAVLINSATGQTKAFPDGQATGALCANCGHMMHPLRLKEAMMLGQGPPVGKEGEPEV